MKSINHKPSHNKYSLLPKRHKLIRKQPKLVKDEQKKKSNGFVSSSQALGPFSANEAERAWQFSAGQWIRRTQDLYEASESQLRNTIDGVLAQLSTFASIEDLFSLEVGSKLISEPDLHCFYRYRHMVSFTRTCDGHTLLMRGDQASAVGHVASSRQGDRHLNSVLLLSPFELETLQKRALFMEKLAASEGKYDTSISRMTPLSKELAFAYRIYLLQRSQLTDTLDLLAAKLPSSQQSFYDYTEYSHILLRQNLKNAFIRGEVDLLNYFKQKELSETDSLHSFRPLRNLNDLRLFIQRRKPKRGRKIHLATACSVCLSDRHQLSNPLHACTICGIRAHSLCFRFQRKQCGNCIYRKIERQMKEKMSKCFICRLPGLMTLKFGEYQFAHAFCLLAHGYWRLQDEERAVKDDQRRQTGIRCNSSEFVLQCQFKTFLRKIKFVNPKQNCTTSSLPIIDSTVYATDIVEQGEQDSENRSILGDIGVAQEDSQIDVWENQLQKKQACGCCKQIFYKKCYSSCETCGQVYHILCAFLAGFDLKISEYGLPNGLLNQIIVNCCCERKTEVAWSRKYKLNYEKIAFSLQLTPTPAIESLMQSQELQLPFNY